MARTLAFDRAAAVRAARTVFWRKGFGETSLPDIEEATGLSRSSIYNSFGSKRGLFDAAVQNYLDEVIRPRLRPLQQEPITPEAILDYLDGLIDTFGSADILPGCLLVNTAHTPLAEEGDVAEVILAYRRELREAIGGGVHSYLQSEATQPDTRIADSITDLVIAAFTLVRIAPTTAIRTLTTAKDILAMARERTQPLR